MTAPGRLRGVVNVVGHARAQLRCAVAERGGRVSACARACAGGASRTVAWEKKGGKSTARTMGSGCPWISKCCRMPAVHAGRRWFERK